MEYHQKLITRLKSYYRQKEELEGLLKTKTPVNGNAIDFSYFQLKKKSKEISKDIEKIQSHLTQNIIA